MKITGAANLQWNNAQNTSFNCMITTDMYGATQLPFTCMPNDVMPYGAQLWIDANAGNYGPIAAYVAPT